LTASGTRRTRRRRRIKTLPCPSRLSISADFLILPFHLHDILGVASLSKRTKNPLESSEHYYVNYSNERNQFVVLLLLLTFGQHKQQQQQQQQTKIAA